MSFECSKRVRGLLRQLAGTAHERELRGHLIKLEQAFGRWRQGEMDTWDLAEQVDRFARGPVRRRLAGLYNTNSIMHMGVAQAIVRGLLTQEEVPAEILVALEKPIEFYRQGLAAGTISFEEED